MIGKTFGHYHIVEKIGKGGMGEVYRARDTRLDRDVALKILPEDMAANPDRVRRFEREAKAVAALNHPNIVTIHSVEEVDGRHCLTMELVEGKTFSELIPPGGMALEKFFDLAIPLADALSAAHAKGITHRDLKPSNVMVDADGRLKVLDFGLAKLLAAPEVAEGETVAGDDSVTAEGRIVGTVYYMSPEQAEAKAIDHRSDIFSLGVVLYEMATGDRPFQGDTPISTISSILRETPPAVTEKKGTLPRHLARVISRCLEKNPDKRFQTARDVCNELEGLKKEVESGDIEQSISGTISRDSLDLSSQGRRNPWPFLVGVVAAVAVLAYFAFLRDRPEPAVHRTVETRPMTSLVGTEMPGSWSPDGGFFAYTHSASGALDIFVVSAAGGDPIKLVESPSDDMSPRWSPDNRWIAFISNRGQKSGIYLIPPLGGPVQKLVETGFQPLSNMMYGSLGSNPWSPDGRTLFFCRMDDAGEMAMWSIDLESRAEKQLTKPGENALDAAATVSFAGDRIAFCRAQRQGSALMTMPVSGGEATEVFSSKDAFMMPAWSPDGRTLVFSSDEGGIWAVDIGSSRKRQVTTGETEGGAVVSKSGEILYATFSHQTDLYIQDLDGADVERLTRHTHDNFGAQLSPDGSDVVYLSSRTGNSEIWLLDRTSGRERQLTNREASDWGPCWSPDGREVIFGSDADGAPALWVATVDGGALRKLDSHDVPAGGPVWSPDPSVIGFVSYTGGESSLYVTDPQGSAVRKVLDGVEEFQWYQDANRIIYAARVPGSGAEMRAANLETGETVLLYNEPFREIAVAPDGSAVSFLSAQSHYNMNLHVLRLSAPISPGGLPTVSGPPEKITHGDGEWHVHNGGWSPDAKQVIYTRDTDTGDIYLLEGAL